MTATGPAEYVRPVPGAEGIEQVPFLAGLGALEQAAIVDGSRRRRFAVGEHLLRQGSAGDTVLVLLTGTVKVLSVGGSQPAVIALRGPGEIIGELAVLDGTPRSAEAVAVVEGEALEIAGQVLRRVMDEAPAARRRLHEVLTRRLRESTAHGLEYAALDLTGRLALRILELAQRFGEERGDGTIRIDPPISRAELASWAGGSRGAGARALGALRAAGWVDTPGRLIVIRDRAALERLVAPAR